MKGISSYPVIMGAIQISRMVTQMLGITTLKQHSMSLQGGDAGESTERRMRG